MEQQGQIQEREVPRMRKVAEMTVGGGSPVGPALAFLAGEEKKSVTGISDTSAVLNTINMCQIFLNIDQVNHRKEVYT